MRRCAFLTMENQAGHVIDDQLAVPPLLTLGWAVDLVPWTRPGVDWDAYDLVVVRSPWDYPLMPERFLEVLADIEHRGVPLLNPLSLIRWNLCKTYLRDLAARGVATVPTLFRDALVPGGLAPLLQELGSPEAVIKPVVGANAGGAFRVSRRALTGQAAEVEAHFAARALMLQPLAGAILEEGEFSLIYFNGELSHAILKTPGPGDFRVQEEHGGIIRPVVADGALRAAGDTAMAPLDDAPLYARVDLVRANDGDGYWLMEFELIEPSLYLRMDPAAPARFAAAVAARRSAPAVG